MLSTFNFKYGQHKYWTKAMLIGISLIALGGCANMSPTGQRALSGGAIGAAGGAVLGAVAGGNPAVGAAVGGAAGAATGALMH
ncbi:MAG: hypothetical protein PHO38_08700 [Acidithiobacillus sp.]|nr:YMGG-like glycine zipper-containing protein [Acidithiobacillus sp.]MDD5375690.1 hypothetical protein [Acidithiobacillus sp.]